MWNLAKAHGGLNVTFTSHYFKGGGAQFDVTSVGPFKSEIEAHYKATIDKELADIRSKVEAAQCPKKLSKFSVQFLGDANYTPISPVSRFKSNVWVLRSVQSRYSKRSTAILICKCNNKTNIMEPWAASTDTRFRLYLYDQFADAADLRHKNRTNDEFKGGKPFDVVGSWGKGYVQQGRYE